jgi:hypothetical protein
MACVAFAIGLCRQASDKYLEVFKMVKGSEKLQKLIMQVAAKIGQEIFGKERGDGALFIKRNLRRTQNERLDSIRTEVA